MHATGRRAPSDDRHMRKFPYRGRAGGDVEEILRLPAWAPTWNQRRLDACAGFSTAMCLSVLNEQNALDHKARPYERKYDAVALWWQARLIDEFPENDDLTDPNQGTTLRATLEVMRTTGPKLLRGGKADPPDPAQGIREYRWGKTIDDMRAAIGKDRTPVALGIDAWVGLGFPVRVGGELWVGEGIPGWKRGLFLGAHAVAAVGISDRREAVLCQNSWATPAWWMPYSHIQKEISRAEFGLITDRPTP